MTLDDTEIDYLTVLVPVTITDAMLISCTVAEPAAGDPAAWNAATNYAVGDLVLRTTTHRIYKALVAGTNAGLPEATPTRWFDFDSSSRWCALDNKPGAATVSAASPLTYVLRPGRVDTLWLGGVDAAHVVVTVKDMTGGTVVFTYDADLEASEPPDYYEYFFSPFLPETDLLLYDLPPYNDMEITVTLTSSTPISLSVLAVGVTSFLAESLCGASAKPRSFATIKLDENGNNKTTQGAATKDLTLKGLISDIDAVDTAVDTVTRYLTTNCLWSGSADPSYTALRSYGLGSAQFDYTDPETVEVTITVQGVLSP